MLLSVRTFAFAALVAAAVPAFASHSPAEEGATAPSPIRIYKHSVWSDIAPKGVDAHGVRQNLAPGKSVKLDGLTITLKEHIAGKQKTETDAAIPDKATLTIAEGDATETKTVNEGDAFNWKAYHIDVPAIYLADGELGHGYTVVEAATIASLPERVATSTKANGAEDRLRVKHTISKLTLHHSGTTLKAEDDLPTKLKNEQAWGETDRQRYDVPYHFFVGMDGTIYQGRDYQYTGDTNTGYDTNGHFLINCYGNYQVAEPNEKQLESIAELMAWAAYENHIDPIKIFGHRDLAETDCPGKNLYKYIEDGSLQKRVEAILKAGKPTVIWLDKKEESAAAPTVMEGAGKK
ncbi:hypothetical protein BH09SUM1_BH09SUM1_08370 [soil metagenome]